MQNRTVSRASVNADRQKGPRLAQSFSTKVAIESGLYIAPGTMDFGSGHRFPDLAPESPGRARTCQTWRQVGNLPDSDFRTSEPEPRFWRQSPEIPKSCRNLEILEILGNPGNPENLDFSRKVEISAISWIPGSDRFRSPDAIRS